MCAIVGFVDFKNKSSKNILSQMLSVLRYRGPDNTDLEFIHKDNIQVAIGHNRLSIIDLSPNGHQPYKFDNFILVHNGEVYNFQEIRAELEKLGYDFVSHSDTEVIIKAYHAWGDNAISKFNGMFALCIYDTKNNTLKLIRDRVGVKPLYYYQKDDLFMFASELKAFHKHPLFDKEISSYALDLYLKYGSILQPYSIFKYAKKVENGQILSLNLNSKQITKSTYWDIYDFYKKPKLKISEQEALDELENLVNSSVKYRLISDVPFGSFLSGGYDSSLVTAFMQKNSDKKIKTFTIGFENPKFDETNYAALVANHLNTDHIEYICTPNDVLDILPNLSDILDEPMADVSVIPTLLVSKITKQKVTVSLSGDGGDELFAGYKSYNKIIKLNNTLRFTPFRHSVGNLLKNININAKFDRKIARISSMFLAKNIIELEDSFQNLFLDINIASLKSDFKFDNLPNLLNNDLDTLLMRDFKSFLIDQLLVKTDRASMYYSLESREPLLDFRIVEFAAQLSNNLKLKNGEGKYLLKKLTHKYIPKNIMDRPKMGFSVPIQDWFESDIKIYARKYLDNQKIKKQNLFNAYEVMRIANNYFNGNNVNFRQLWGLLVFQMWYERWINE